MNMALYAQPDFIKYWYSWKIKLKKINQSKEK